MYCSLVSSPFEYLSDRISSAVLITGQLGTRILSLLISLYMRYATPITIISQNRPIPIPIKDASSGDSMAYVLLL